MPFERELKRNLYTIEKQGERFAIVAPKRKGLVLSGGGAKGISYAGMTQALYEQALHGEGCMQSITHVSGASAGAMAASFIALGVSQENIYKLITQLNITNLLDNDGFARMRARGERFRNVLELIYMVQVKQYLTSQAGVWSAAQRQQAASLQLKMKMYENTLASQGLVIGHMDDIIDLAKTREQLNKMDKAFELLPKRMHDKAGALLENPRINFTDLKILRSLLPLEQQHLIKNLSVITTNQANQQSEIYSEDQHAHHSIAEIVQFSGAHPVLFEPQLNSDGHYIADGGISDNMPTQALEEAGLSVEEILCVKVESDTDFHRRVRRANTHKPEDSPWFDRLTDNIMNNIVGGRLYQNRVMVANREKVFHYVGNMLYLNSGAITTTSTSPTQAQKEEAIQTAYRQTCELIQHTISFTNPLSAMLFIGLDRLNATMLGDDPILLKAAAYAKTIFLLQKTMAHEINAGHFGDVENYIRQIRDTLKFDAKMQRPERQTALAFCLKQVCFLTNGKLDEYIKDRLVKAETPAQQNFWQWLLELLWTPFAWLISQFSTTTTDISTNDEINDNIDVISSISTEEMYYPKRDKAEDLMDTSPLSNLSLFTPSRSRRSSSVISNAPLSSDAPSSCDISSANGTPLSSDTPNSDPSSSPSISF